MGMLFEMGTIVAALSIFFLRIVDVSLGTVRTISLVHGRIVLAVVLGFFEVLIWAAVISQVIVRVQDNPVLLLAYAAGFAVGNGVGIVIERKVAIGNQVIRFITRHNGKSVADALRNLGQGVTAFRGEGRDGPVDLLYVTCPRKWAGVLIQKALAVDPDVFYVSEAATGINRRLPIPPHPSGWRSVAKRK